MNAATNNRRENMMMRTGSRKRAWTAILTCWVGGALWAGAAAGADLTIAAGGRTDAVICLSAEAAGQERQAAEDLARTIELMSGARPAIVTDPTAIAAALGEDLPVFVLGELALDTLPALREALREVVPPTRVRREGDAIVLRRDGNRVYLAGINERSHYFAVTRLLNRWGCYWYMPTAFGECIPERPTLTLSDLNEIHAVLL